jgi:flagellin-like hook-associated protein FlgL
MTISKNLIYSMQSLNNKITETSKTIDRGGLKNTTENLFHKLRNDEFQAVKNMEIKGLDAVIEKYKHYGNIFDEMALQIEEISKKVIDSIDGGLNEEGKDAIQAELSSIQEYMETLTNTEVSGTKLFDIETEMVIGDGMRATRTFDRDFIKIDGQEITDYIQTIIDSIDTDTQDLDAVEKLHNFIQERNTIIGAKESGYNSTKAIYENHQLSENEFMSKRYKLEESIQELNDLSLSYEALMKTIAKISSLSLVNYM